ncbi:AsnC family transcriptional regulator [Rathayibacter caricis]|uniref:AsnC family transcriptional regulator n=1 Tax=Rathayibacter caricis TaxID=110936 RepID=UPI001FB450EA|nr:AsnC family transcriptional regulator [Rathayibacter caricis]MCJ1697797.1 AsnC family transcriptional regulator [Rathayibacter caricis]
MQDDIDGAIIAMLIEDTRATHRRIAESTGMSESAVRIRLQRILAEGRVTPSVLIHPDVEGQRFVYMTRLTIDTVADAPGMLDGGVMADSPWVARVSTSGELLAQFAAQSAEEMIAGVDRARHAPGVVRASSSFISRIYVGADFDSSGEEHADWSSLPTRPMDAVDRSIVSELRRDGRTSYTDLSSAVGLTVAATRRRVIKLVEDGLIRFATRLNDESLASAEAAIDLAVNSVDFDAVVGALLERRSVRYVIEQTGRFALAAYVVGADTRALAAAVDDIVRDERIREHRIDPLVVLRDRLSWFGGVS